jgi:transcription-repair coupling factor (superfamily II helicase)
MFTLGTHGQDVVDRLMGLLNGTGTVTLEGLWGSSAPFLAGHIISKMPRHALYITAHIDQADRIQEDLETFSGRVVEVLPGWESSKPELMVGDEIAAERLEVLTRLTKAVMENNPTIVVAPIQAMMFPTPTREVLQSNSLTIEAGLTIGIETLAKWLVDRGYNRLDQVEQPGDFSVRGDIVDIYPSGVGYPIRCDFFDDQIESIRRFDPGSQRSLETLKNFTINALPEFLDMQSACNFLDHLPADTVIFWHEPVEISEVARTFLLRLPDPLGMYPFESIFTRAKNFPQISLMRFLAEFTQNRVHVDITALPKFETQVHQALDQLITLSHELSKIYIFCENAAQRDRLAELLGAKDAAWMNRISLVDGLLGTGFIWKDEGFACLGDQELFHRYEYRHRLRKRSTIRTVDNFLELEHGDYVVHVNHGIGRFQGLQTKRGITGRTEEYLAIQYADNAIVHVPVGQMDLVQKYVGGFKGHPPLSKLGSKAWQTAKQRVVEAVSEMAEEMLEVQAQREAMGGIAFPADNDWQKQMEESFIYQETEDQLLTIRDIKLDMMKPRAMDRLLCGDVGYGKTEIAIRAAFKAVAAGYQVAVLVPTTILAEQHYRTFKERLAEFPFTVDYLNRFRTNSEQAVTISKAMDGKIDILIGTHRILSDDVQFSNLGLVIVDEEQRFGVVHKEKLKKMRATVDILTLTATPIPRTLHMSLIGLRDISTLTTPPLDRRSIQTEIRKFDLQLIRNGILRELNRDGQVFFVHNYVHDIESLAAQLRQAVPEARFIVGHGQMKARELESVMMKFLNRQADVLVSTTIVESGVDIPTANTMFINNADHFGLAELHQLRGRVGRYKYRAYAYLLIPEKRPITPIAERRLRAVEEYSELGAGFRIAMRDLEIRGAGNILGAEQSGHIAAVGYELYCDLLASAVRRLKKDEPQAIRKANIDLALSGFVPARYIASDRQRLEIYRRLAQSQSVSEINQLDKDICDIFGVKMPPEVVLMLDLARLRLLAGRWGIKSIVYREDELVFSLTDAMISQEIFSRIRIKPRFFEPTEVHLPLPPRYAETKTLIRMLYKMLEHHAETGPGQGKQA